MRDADGLLLMKCADGSTIIPYKRENELAHLLAQLQACDRQADVPESSSSVGISVVWANMKCCLVYSEPSCPQCRVPMQSRRDCKKDPRYDRLLAVLYANIYSYEEKVRPAINPAEGPQ